VGFLPRSGVLSTKKTGTSALLLVGETRRHRVIQGASYQMRRIKGIILAGGLLMLASSALATTGASAAIKLTPVPSEAKPMKFTLSASGFNTDTGRLPWECRGEGVVEGQLTSTTEGSVTIAHFKGCSVTGDGGIKSEGAASEEIKFTAGLKVRLVYTSKANHEIGLYIFNPASPAYETSGSEYTASLSTLGGELEYGPLAGWTAGSVGWRNGETSASAPVKFSPAGGSFENQQGGTTKVSTHITSGRTEYSEPISWAPTLKLATSEKLED
jgi:hypothetical protein